MRRCGVVILTALPVEYAAVRAHLEAHPLTESVHSTGTVYERGQFQGQFVDWEVAIVEVGAGNESAALEVERALTAFRPAVALFVGVAGGIKDVAIGDVVLSTKIYGYESGKANKTFATRPSVGETSYGLEQRGRAVARNTDWLTRVRSLPENLRPRAIVGPIAAGEKVVASTQSAIYRFLRQSYGDAVAVEMEGRGFLRGVRGHKGVDAGVVRGISDLLDDKTAADQGGSQEMAAEHAAAFAFQLLDRFDPQPDAPTLGDRATQRTTYTVVISGTFDEQGLALARAVFATLKTRAADPTMILERIEPGSIKLVISGSREGLERLARLEKEGPLTPTIAREVRLDTSEVQSAPFAPPAAAVGNIPASMLADLVKLAGTFAMTILRSRDKGAQASAIRDEGQEIAQEVLLTILSQVGEGKAPEDVTIEDYVKVLVRRIVRRRLEKEMVRRREETDVDADVLQEIPESAGEHLITHHQLTMMEHWLEREPTLQEYFRLIMRGEDTRGQMEALGVSRRQLQNLQRRLHRELHYVLAASKDAR